jgi:Effector Associated Constant Component 1
MEADMDFPMEAEIRICRGDDVGEFTDLWRWLRGERALSGMICAARRPPAETELGGACDVLAVALGSGGAGAALARSLIVWLQTRRPIVAVTVTSPSGTVTVDARQIRDGDVLPVLNEILRARDES